MKDRIDEHIEFHEDNDKHKSDVAFLKEVKAYIEELELAITKKDKKLYEFYYREACQHASGHQNAINYVNLMMKEDK